MRLQTQCSYVFARNLLLTISNSFPTGISSRPPSGNSGKLFGVSTPIDCSFRRTVLSGPSRRAAAPRCPPVSRMYGGGAFHRRPGGQERGATGGNGPPKPLRQRWRRRAPLPYSLPRRRRRARSLPRRSKSSAMRANRSESLLCAKFVISRWPKQASVAYLFASFR
jgi:hypothetical protein